MRLYVLPSSGQSFPKQIAILMNMYNISPRPDLMLGTSGGNLAGYLSLAADFSPDGMERICHFISSKLFSVTWFPSYLYFLPSIVVGFFKSSLYKQGSGSVELMKNIFTPQNISAVEILTGTCERSTGKQQIFSNKSEEDSILKDVPFDYNINNCLPVQYVNADIEKIAKICIASASIPVLVPDEKIEDSFFMDGGVNARSCLTPLVDTLDFIGINKEMHLDYINGTDLDSKFEDPEYYNIVQNTDSTLNRIIKSLAVLDRLNGIEFVRKSVYRNKYHLLYFEADCNDEVLKNIESARRYSKRSFLELYTPIKKEIDLTDFKFKDIMELVWKVKKKYAFRLWITASNSNRQKIMDLLGSYVPERESMRNLVNSETD